MLAEYYDTAHAGEHPECDRLARTIRCRQCEVLAYYRSDGCPTHRAVIIWSRAQAVVDVADEVARVRG